MNSNLFQKVFFPIMATLGRHFSDVLWNKTKGREAGRQWREWSEALYHWVFFLCCHKRFLYVLWKKNVCEWSGTTNLCFDLQLGNCWTSSFETSTRLTGRTVKLAFLGYAVLHCVTLFRCRFLIACFANAREFCLIFEVIPPSAIFCRFFPGARTKLTVVPMEFNQKVILREKYSVI